MTNYNQVKLMSRLLKLGILLLIVGACSGNNKNSQPNSSSNSLATGPFNITLHQVAISSEEAPVYNVQSIAWPQGKGSIYVNDFSDMHQILVFSRNRDSLKLIRRLGQKGSGPGDFDIIQYIQETGQDSLFIYDRQLLRFTIINSATGKPLDVYNLLQPAPHQLDWIHKIRGANCVLLAYSDYDPLSKIDPAKMKLILQLDTINGKILQDSLLVMPNDSWLVLHYKDGGTEYLEGPPFGRNNLLRFGRFQNKPVIYRIWNDSASVQIIGLNGTMLETISIPPYSIPVLPSDINYFVHQRFKRTSQWGKKFIQTAPKTWPMIQQFILDNHNHLWIIYSSHVNDPHIAIEMNRQGKILDKTHIPAQLTVFGIDDSMVVGVLNNNNHANTLPQLVLYHIDHSTVN